MAGNGEKNHWADDSWIIAVLLPLFVILVGCGAQAAEATTEAEAVTSVPAEVENEVVDTPTTVQTESTTTVAEALVPVGEEPRFEIFSRRLHHLKRSIVLRTRWSMRCLATQLPRCEKGQT